MNCVKSRHSAEDQIKKSRFIGVISPCSDEAEVASLLEQLHLEHPTATHIAYAWRIKTGNTINYRFHDAGEPTGTAGKPVFLHLEGKDLINCLVAVVRYFGGIKLGAGGLARAYGNSARLVIASAEISPFVTLSTVQLTIDYHRLQALEYELKKFDGQIIKQEFSEQVHLQIQLPTEEMESFSRLFPKRE
jgi:uncharacterized YigZ family protein